MDIDGFKVETYDDLLNEDQLQPLDILANTSFYKRQEKAVLDYDYAHYSCHYDIEDIRKYMFFDTVADKIPNKDLVLTDAYINSESYGDQTFIHKDSNDPDYTALIYVVKDWDVNYGGETVYYDEKDEPVLTILPKRGRVVISDSRVGHVGKPPNRIFLGDRYTMALKFKSH